MHVVPSLGMAFALSDFVGALFDTFFLFR